MKLQTVREINIVGKVCEYLHVNGIQNEINVVRKLSHIKEMPFSKENLDEFKKIREAEFKRFVKKIGTLDFL